MSHSQKYYCKSLILTAVLFVGYFGLASIGYGLGVLYFSIATVIPFLLAFVIWPDVWTPKQLSPKNIGRIKIITSVMYVAVSAFILFLQIAHVPSSK